MSCGGSCVLAGKIDSLCDNFFRQAANSERNSAPIGESSKLKLAYLRSRRRQTAFILWRLRLLLVHEDYAPAMLNKVPEFNEPEPLPFGSEEGQRVGIDLLASRTYGL